MIEITNDDGEVVTATGPHSPEGTRAIAAGIDQAMRMLTYATRPGSDGIVHPNTVYDVYGDLIAAIDKLPQALRQMEEWTREQAVALAIRENPEHGKHGGNVHAAHSALHAATRAAITQAAELARVLKHAQRATSGLESTGRDSASGLTRAEREALSMEPVVVARIAKELRDRYEHGGANVDFEAAAQEVIRQYGASTIKGYLLDGALITIMSRHRRPQPSPADPPVTWDD